MVLYHKKWTTPFYLLLLKAEVRSVNVIIILKQNKNSDIEYK